MKAVLQISVLANFVLVGCLVFLLMGVHRLTSQPPRSPGETKLVLTESAAFAPPGRESLPFHWSKIESTDYRRYISNLRGIGCPEQTIRDIITADIDSLYASKRKQVQAGAALRQMATEEAVLIELLLRGEAAAMQIASDAGLQSPLPARISRQKLDDSRVEVPLVFKDVDLATLKLGPSQVQAIEELRQRFVEAVGGTDQNPDDPKYRERWQKNQPEIDDLLRGMIGINAYQDFDLAARGNQGQEAGNNQQN